MSSLVFKICVFGDGGVGKTTFINNFVNFRFEEDTKMTIGVSIAAKELIIEKKKVILQIWDFGGEDRFRFFLPSFCKGSLGGIFMYDITRMNTLFNLDEWLKIFNQNASFIEKHIPVYIIGGKLDLEKKRAIKFENVLDFIKNKEISKVYECSAKTGQNVELIFNNLSFEIMKNLGII